MNIPNSQENTILNKFFVYGTLRPDIKAPWTDIVHINKDFEIISRKAYVTNSILQLFRDFDFPNVSFCKQTYKEHDIVFGYLLESTNTSLTLKILDEIEEYPEVYDRIVVTCFNIEDNKYEDAYMYTIKQTHHLMHTAYQCEHNDMKLLLDRI